MLTPKAIAAKSRTERRREKETQCDSTIEGEKERTAPGCVKELERHGRKKKESAEAREKEG